MSFVEGSYVTSQEAIAAVKRLKAEGYKEKDIRLVSNTETQDAFMDKSSIDITTDTDRATDTDRTTDHDDLSIWEKMKDAFTPHDDTDHSTMKDDDPLYAYQKDIETGNIVVVVDGEPKTDTAPIAGRNTSGTQGKMTDDEKTIRLKEEELDVDKKDIQTGEVNVSKRVVEETETVEVPVEHEEVTIERNPVKPGEKVTGRMDMNDESITIPVKEEQIEVTKKPVVKEEVKIGKEKVKDTKQVKETVEKEELDVDTDGDVKIDKNKNRRKR